MLHRTHAQAEATGWVSLKSMASVDSSGVKLKTALALPFDDNCILQKFHFHSARFSLTANSDGGILHKPLM